ncbi:hypothetical protein HYT01_00565 [Candidatus Giovannonibacteria bacterium]|nr:hypothetical protein [Candidatus Giovannonibacteria bacterium]
MRLMLLAVILVSLALHGCTAVGTVVGPVMYPAHCIGKQADRKSAGGVAGAILLAPVYAVYGLFAGAANGFALDVEVVKQGKGLSGAGVPNPPDICLN